MPKDFKIDFETGDLVYEGGDFAVRDDILNDIYFSLKIRLGSWIGNKARGSELYTLKKAVKEAPARAKEMCEKALKWLIDERRATRIDVETEMVKSDVTSRLNIQITAWQNGQPQVYKFFKEVR